MSQEHYFVASPGVLGVRTNLERFSWSFGSTMPQAERSEFDACRLRLRVDVTRNLTMPSTTRFGKYHYWYGAPGEDALYYDRRFLFGSRLQLAAQGLLGDEPTLTVNRAYYRCISHRFMNLHSVGYILTDLAALLLLQRGLAPLHCSAFRLGDATVVVAAPPNTGKTLTAMTACLNHGADFIAEDLAVTDGRDVFAVPWTSTFRYYQQIDRSLASRMRDKATRLFPPIELWSGRRPAPVTEYIASHRVVARSPVTHLVLLERGKPQVQSLEHDEAFRKLRNLNRYEFNYHKAPLAVAYEYFNPQLNIEAACRAEDASIRRLLENSPHVWVVRSDDPTQYAPIIVDAIGRRGSSSPERVAA